MLSGNQLLGEALKFWGNGKGRVSPLSIWRRYAPVGSAYATYLPSGETTAARIGASTGLAVIRFSTAIYDAPRLTRHWTTKAALTIAAAIRRRYQRTCFSDFAVRSPTAVSCGRPTSTEVSCCSAPPVCAAVVTG